MKSLTEELFAKGFTKADVEQLMAAQTNILISSTAVRRIMDFVDDIVDAIAVGNELIKYRANDQELDGVEVSKILAKVSREKIERTKAKSDSIDLEAGVKDDIFGRRYNNLAPR